MRRVEPENWSPLAASQQVLAVNVQHADRICEAKTVLERFHCKPQREVVFKNESKLRVKFCNLKSFQLGNSYDKC